MLYKHVAKPILFRMDPEKAHHLTIGGLSAASRIPGGAALIRSVYGVRRRTELAVRLWDIDFPNPIGLAAGLDKNARAVPGFSAMGFGFLEVGTVTPVGQPGNELPRLFRLPPDSALINRMGFNNEGAQKMAERLSGLSDRPIPIAVNIGKNKATPNGEAAEDYRKCLSALYPYGDFFVVNISSPNTPDLRSLQHGDDLRELLQAVKDEMNCQRQLNQGKAKPVLVKIAPDVTFEQLEVMVETIAQSGAAGIIATNTTVQRDGLRHPNAGQSGGLSGKPLTSRSTEIIRRIYAMTEGKLPIIGSGGVFTAEDAYEKIKAGASLVEIYTALIYEGPGLLRTMNEGLLQLLRRDGLANIAQAVGVESQGH